MKCLIIAAGLGSRLSEVAESKPLAPVAGRPLIEHVVTSAKAGGATSFVVVTGYAADQVEPFLADLAERTAVPIEAVRNPDWKRPNGISVLAAADALGSEEFLLLMSDHLFDPAIAAGLLAAGQRGALTLAVDRAIDDPRIDLDDATKVATGEEGRIVAIGKTIPAYDSIDTGIFRTGPGLIEALRRSVDRGAAGSLSEGVQMLAGEGRAFVHDIGAGAWWLDVDDPRALGLAEERFASAAPL